MKFKLIIPFLAINACSFCQIISGKVVNESTGEPLEFASVGVVGHEVGIITDVKGLFKLDLRGISADGQVRFSMIGFQAQTILLKEIVDKEIVVKLKEQSINLKEVVVKTSKSKRKTIGGKSSSGFTVTGWGNSGAGGERGTLITIKNPVFIEKVSFHIAYLGFDSVLLRLHVRDIVNGEPEEELLNENIMKVAGSTGWHEINLIPYNLTYEKNIVVTMEWVKSWGKNRDTYNGLKFSINWFKGPIFAKEAGESKWVTYKKWQPGIYLTVLE